MTSASSPDLARTVAALQGFSGADLTQTLAKVKSSLQGVTTATCAAMLAKWGAGEEVLAAAGLMKRVAGQINVLVHALGILLCLPRLLQPGEVVEYASLGAGNTGRPFDLETSYRIAEFKFIRWQGGPEVIRQNALFKDFYLLAEHPTSKLRYLYVLGTSQPVKFLSGGRSLASVLSRHVGLQNQFRAKFGDRLQTVRDYYSLRKDVVLIQDVSSWVPGLIGAVDEIEGTGAA